MTIRQVLEYVDKLTREGRLPGRPSAPTKGRGIAGWIHYHKQDYSPWYIKLLEKVIGFHEGKKGRRRNK